MWVSSCPRSLASRRLCCVTEVMMLESVKNTNCAVEGNLELMIKRGDIDKKRLVTNMVKI